MATIVYVNPNQELVTIIVFLVLLFVVLPGVIVGIAVPVSVHKHKYMDFVDNYSSALNGIKSVNGKYSFYMIPNLDMNHSYDNNDYYPTVSCEDYLIYQLQFHKTQKNVINAIESASINKNRFDSYKKEVSKCKFGVFTKDTEGYKLDTLKKYEERMVKNILYRPQIKFDITVVLKRTDVNGRYLESKFDAFTSFEIEEIIERLHNRSGDYYRDKEVWNSIVRVERARVSNRMRFAIFQRDHERCRYCGSRRNLEIDHIIPVSKGGKSTMDNLQTLCHRCNVRKGNNILS